MKLYFAKKNGVYGLLKRKEPDAQVYHEVIDVSDISSAEGRDITEDWTEVVLYGNDPHQETAVDPYNSDPKQQERYWIATYLYHRFYRLPDGVELKLEGSVNRWKSRRNFDPVSERMKTHFEKCESIKAGKEGITIHYLYDAPSYDASDPDRGSGHNKSSKGSIASAVSFCAIVYKNELYDLKRSKDWTQDAPIYGVTFGAKSISIHIELPDDYPVVPEAYRTFLQSSAGNQERITCKNFSELVREHTPNWLKIIIRSLAPDNQQNEGVREELQRLLNNLRIKRQSPRLNEEGPLRVDKGVGAGAERENGKGEGITPSPEYKATDLAIMPSGAKRAETFLNAERAPEIVPLRSGDEIEEKGLRGRSGRFYPDTGQLFINMQYAAIREMQAQLELEYAGSADLESMRSLALQHAERTITLQVGRAVVFALAKRLNKEWDHTAIERAWSPETLSIAADDYHDGMQSSRRAMSIALRTSRAIVEVEE